MADMRDRLIELLEKAFEFYIDDPYCIPDAGEFADHLLANGVILPGWISVKERLPELHTKVLCCGVRGGMFIAETSEWGDGHLYWTKRDGKGCPEVTHWMPLPQPPKAEKALREKENV